MLPNSSPALHFNGKYYTLFTPRYVFLTAISEIADEPNMKED